MAVDTTAVDCSNLDAFQSFQDYMSLLRNRTSFNETLLEQCRTSVCGALWGYGVPDISGIGVAVGYMLATIIGPLLSILLLLSLPPSPNFLTKTITYTVNKLPPRVHKYLPTKSTLQKVLIAGLTAFFESAIYFALVIEIATITILAPKDYESKTTAFGDYDARTCSLVSTICLLPLLYPVSILSLLGPHSSANQFPHPSPSATELATLSPRTPTAPPPPTTSTAPIPPPSPSPNPETPTTPPQPPTNPLHKTHHRHPHRLTLFLLSTLLSIYPFLSQSLRTWAPSQVGTGKGDHGDTYVTEDEWPHVTAVCFDGVNTLTRVEDVVLGVFQTVAAGVVVLFGVGVLSPGVLRGVGWLCYREDRGEGEGGGEDGDREGDVEDGGRGSGEGKWRGWVLRVTGRLLGVCEEVKTRCRTSRVLAVVLLAVPLVLAVPLLWGFWRLRGLQGQLATATGGRDEGGEWSFGQVVAITIFVPVGAEMVFIAVCGDGRHDEGEVDENDGGEKGDEEIVRETVA